MVLVSRETGSAFDVLFHVKRLGWSSLRAYELQVEAGLLHMQIDRTPAQL